MRLGVNVGHPDDVEGVRAALVLPARADDGEEFVVGHFEKIARREPIGGVQDVGLAPANELLAQIDGKRAFSQRGMRMPQRERRALETAIAHVDAPYPLDLL